MIRVNKRIFHIWSTGHDLLRLATISLTKRQNEGKSKIFSYFEINTRHDKKRQRQDGIKSISPLRFIIIDDSISFTCIKLCSKTRMHLNRHKRCSSINFRYQTKCLCLIIMVYDIIFERPWIHLIGFDPLKMLSFA